LLKNFLFTLNHERNASFSKYNTRHHEIKLDIFSFLGVALLYQQNQ
jgi:hypothetical protein